MTESKIHIHTIRGPHQVDSVDDLQEVVESICEATNWLFIDGEMVGAFFNNGEHACVYRNSDGAWSFNPNNPKDQVAPFILENGELDEFPLSHCIDYESAMDAFIELARTGELSTRIQWY